MSELAAFVPKAEVLWRPDTNVDAARRLPEWLAFHIACREHGLYFDHIERLRRGGPYGCNAFTVRKVRVDYYHYELLAKGQGSTVLEAIADAYANSGRAIPAAAAMLERGMAGTAVAALPVTALPDDDFAILIPVPPPSAASTGDDFSELLA